jgi:biopolymer transport protein TolR
MRSERRSRNRLVSQINVVPYIDVMLVLLVIFMVTAPMMNPSQIDLPQVGQSAQPSVAPLEVIIKKDGSLSYRDHARDAQENRTSQNELIVLLQGRQGSRAEQAVVVSADRNVRYDEVVQIMDMLQQQHIKKVGLLTQLKAK